MNTTPLPSLCILAAGIGSRMRELNESLHKGLLPLANIAIIDHIIKKFNPLTPLVVALGYHSNQLQEYLSLAYPQKKIDFFFVDNLGSGPLPFFTVL